jgi:hypothetical protein
LTGPSSKGQRILLSAFAVSLLANALAAVLNFGWYSIPALLVGWFVADMASGLVHMALDYRPCPPGKRLADLYFYEGSRESPEYLGMLHDRMSQVSAFDRLVYDFKNHHPRPHALGRRDLWRQIGSTVVVGALPMSLMLNLAIATAHVPGWLSAGLFAAIAGGGFSQYFHGTLHREKNPWFINLMRRTYLLMTPASHQLHHDSLQRDFATNSGWSNPFINRVFNAMRARGYLDDAGLVPNA